MARIHVAGNSVLDIVVPGHPPAGAGEDAWGANVQVLDAPVGATLGGCGAAPAYLLARLGHEVSLSSNIGGDAVGGILAGWLHQAGVTLDPAPRPHMASATHVIHVSGRQRQSSYYRGDRVDWAAGPKRPDWFVATGYGAVDADDLSTLTQVCGRLQAMGARVLFDPSPWFADRVQARAMRRLWSQVDVLSATEEELAPFLPAAADASTLARAALDTGPSLVVVKRGPAGAAWANADAEGEAPTRPINGNSVGAGDCFNACLVDGLAQGQSAAQAVAAAVTMATKVVEAGRGVLGLFPPTTADTQPGAEIF